MRGVILYNKGQKMGVRIAVCLHSLKKHWRGPITLLHDGADGWDMAKELARHFGIAVKLADWPTVLDCKNATLLNKCQVHTQSSYEVSALIDTDCIVCGRIDELFEAADCSEFAVAQFSDWKTKGKIGKRIKQWRGVVDDEWIYAALAYGPAINTGVYSWRRDSKLMENWLFWAQRKPENFIPDETCCQVILPQFKHELLDPIYNVSCRYARGSQIERARIIHFHGRKHCRFDEAKGHRFNSQIWYREFEEIRSEPIVNSLIKHDRMLRKYVSTWDEVKTCKG